MYINVGCPGRCHDAGIFEKSHLKRLLDGEKLHEHSKVINGVRVPIFVLGDSVFKLENYLMKPYPFSTASTVAEKTFNYCLSKARRVVENAFGQLKGRFRRIGKGIDNKYSNVNAITKACCVLHNFCNENNCEISATWVDVIGVHGTSCVDDPEEENVNARAEEIRRILAQYLSS